MKKDEQCEKLPRKEVVVGDGKFKGRGCQGQRKSHSWKEEWVAEAGTLQEGGKRAESGRGRIQSRAGRRGLGTTGQRNANSK